MQSSTEFSDYQLRKMKQDPEYVPRSVRTAPLREPTDLEIAYAAGFLEGEGCFSWYGNCPRVQATQQSIEPLLFLRVIFGGACNGPDKHGMYRWKVFGDKAITVIELIYPYFLAPKRIAQLGAVLTQRNA